MFESSGNGSHEFDPEQFADWDIDGKMALEPDNCITLIGRNSYGLEVEMSGYVAVETDTLDAEAFLASLYPQL
jgi:hypothetical protein